MWSKQNPYVHMSFLGLFTFTAAYLPWVSDFSVHSNFLNSCAIFPITNSHIPLHLQLINQSNSKTWRSCICCLTTYFLGDCIYGGSWDRSCGTSDIGYFSYLYATGVILDFISQVLLGFSVLVGASAWVDLLVCPLTPFLCKLVRSPIFFPSKKCSYTLKMFCPWKNSFKILFGFGMVLPDHHWFNANIDDLAFWHALIRSVAWYNLHFRESWINLMATSISVDNQFSNLQNSAYDSLCLLLDSSPYTLEDAFTHLVNFNFASGNDCRSCLLLSWRCVPTYDWATTSENSSCYQSIICRWACSGS